jgi:hypothetical protein
LFLHKWTWLEIQGHINAPLESELHTVLKDVQEDLLISLSITRQIIEHEGCLILDVMFNIESLFFGLDLKK